MRKIVPVLASLLLLGKVAAFPQPSLTLESKLSGTNFTVITKDGSLFQFEDSDRNGELDKVTEWPNNSDVATVYKGNEIPDYQKIFFKKATVDYLNQEKDKFLSIFKKNPETLSFYTPFGAGNGKFVFYFEEKKYALYEDQKGLLSVYEGVPIHRWGEKESHSLKVEGVDKNSLMYPIVNSLKELLVSERAKNVDARFAEVEKVLSK